MTDDITACGSCGSTLDLVENPYKTKREIVATCPECGIYTVTDPEEVGRIAYVLAYRGVGFSPKAKHLFNLAGKAQDEGRWTTVTELSIQAIAYEWRAANQVSDARDMGPHHKESCMCRACRGYRLGEVLGFGHDPAPEWTQDGVD